MFTPISQDVQVSFHYKVSFTRGLFREGNTLLRDTLCPELPETPKKVVCAIDQGVISSSPDLLGLITAYFQIYRNYLNLVCKPIIVPGGEQAKNFPSNITLIQNAINECGIDRHSYVVVIGGGAVIDMVGYAAATAHRGVRLVRVPTTVLAQNDSAVGVKNSINAYGKKNFLGTFAPPYAVLNDFHLLKTLEQRDWISGVSEAIKVALLKDAKFFEYIENATFELADRNMQTMEWVIYRCAELHLNHIATSGDPFELGSSRPLDFGHWAAHKLEQLTEYQMRHGEAVAVGIALDATYSFLTGRLPEQDWQRIINVFTALGLAVYDLRLEQYLDTPDDPRCILSGLNEFREHLGGQLTIMLLEGIGKGIEVHEIDEEKMMNSIGLLKEHQEVRLSEGVR